MLVQPSPHLEMVLFSGQWCKKAVWRRDGMLGESCCLLGDSWIPELCGIFWTCEVFLTSKTLGEKQQVPFFPTQNDKSSQNIEERILVDVWAFSLPEPQHSKLVLQLRLNEAHADYRRVTPISAMKHEGCVWLGVCILLVFCHRCNIYVSVSARMYIGCFQCVFFTSLGGYFGSVCSVDDEMRRLYFSEDTSVPCLQPRTLFASAFFHVFFFFFMLLLLFWFVCVTVKCYQLFMI